MCVICIEFEKMVVKNELKLRFICYLYLFYFECLIIVLMLVLFDVIIIFKVFRCVFVDFKKIIFR